MTMESQPSEPRSDRSLTGLLSELARETTTLVRKEIELAKTELSEKVGEATSGVAFLAVGGVIAFAGFLFVLLAATFALSQVLSPWLAAFIVGVVVLAIGLGLLWSGRSKLRAENLQPQRTMESLREDRRWARAQMSR